MQGPAFAPTASVSPAPDAAPTDGRRPDPFAYAPIPVTPTPPYGMPAFAGAPSAPADRGTAPSIAPEYIPTAPHGLPHRSIQGAVPRPKVGELVTTLATADDPLMRSSAAARLGALGAEAVGATFALELSVDDPHPSVRAAAARALAHVASPFPSSTALEALRRRADDESAEAQGAAIVALTSLCALGATDLPWMRRAICGAEAECARAAARGLAHLVRRAHATTDAQSHGAMAILIDAVRQGGIPRQAATQALGDLGPRAVLAVPALREALFDADPLRVVYALARIGTGAEPALADLKSIVARTRNDYDPLYRVTVAAMARISADENPRLCALIEKLETLTVFDENVDVALLTAMAGLGAAGLPFVPKLLDFLEQWADPSLGARSARVDAALVTLASFSSPALADVTQRLLADPRRAPIYRPFAERLRPLLARACADEALRRRATEALALLG